MSTEQKSSGVPIVEMDTRKFLRLINSSAQSKIKLFEDALERMGEKAGRSYRLSALSDSKLVFEDVDTADHFFADIERKSGGRFSLVNIQKIQLVENEKPKKFSSNCTELINAISEGDRKAVEKVWNRIEKQRFRSTVIPESGWITARDGVARRVKIANRELTNEEKIERVALAVLEALSDDVEVNEEGQLTCGTFTEGSGEFVVPIDEYGCRKANARRMKKYAMEAYQRRSFQRLVRNVAALVSHGKLEEAARKSAAFLTEQQEFCLLNPQEMRHLVENSLATQAVFNGFLARDTARLMYRTNMLFNRDTILEAWSDAAQESHRSDLLEAVEELAESRHFVADYPKTILKQVFSEDGPASNQQMLDRTRLMLRAIKDLLRNDPNAAEELETVRELEARIDAKGSMDHRDRDEVDSLAAAIYQHHKDRIDNLEYFTTYPDDEEEKPEGEHEGEPVPMPNELQTADEGLGGIGEFDLGGGEEPGLGPDLGLGLGGEAAAAPVGAGAGAGVPGAEAALGLESKDQFVTIDKMEVKHLAEELEYWKTDGPLYLQEDGFDDCFEQMQHYIRRCLELGPKADHLREEFEYMRENIVESGSDTLKDFPSDDYRSIVDELFEDDLNLDSKYIPEELRSEPGSQDLRMKNKRSSASSSVEGHGSGGVVKGKLKHSDGKSGHQAAGPGGPATGEPGVSDELQGDEVAYDTGVTKSDGRSGHKAAGGGKAPAGAGAMDSKKQGKAGVGKKMGQVAAESRDEDDEDADDEEMLSDDQYTQTGRVKRQRKGATTRHGDEGVHEDVAIVMSTDQHIDDNLIQAVVAAMETGDTEELAAFGDDLEDDDVTTEEDYEDSDSEEEGREEEEETEEEEELEESLSISDRIDRRLKDFAEEGHMTRGSSNKAPKGGHRMDELQDGEGVLDDKSSLGKAPGGARMDELQDGEGVLDGKSGMGKPKGGVEMDEFQDDKGRVDKHAGADGSDKHLKKA